jgi:sulfatase modifying factor 1
MTQRIRARFLLASVVLAVLGAGPASAVALDWVTVGDPGNAPDASSKLENCFTPDCGSVSYPYRIGKYEVTNAQYVEFLNAKAASDPLGLYDPSMGSDPNGGITLSGSDGSYPYATIPGFEDKPVDFVSFYDALRFVNWLANGQGSGDTETGSYTLLGGTEVPSNGLTVTRNPDATIFLPSENEWYKAAYYDPISMAYFRYPTGTNTATGCATPTATPSQANCDDVAGGVVDVGSYTGSASPYGTFDQGGNVWEWNEEIVSGLCRGNRGGGWSLPASDSSLRTRESASPRPRPATRASAWRASPPSRRRASSSWRRSRVWACSRRGAGGLPATADPLFGRPITGRTVGARGRRGTSAGRRAPPQAARGPPPGAAPAAPGR